MKGFIYTEFAVGVNDRGHIVTVHDVKRLVKQLGDPVDVFINTLLFDSTFAEYVKNTGGVRGFHGPAYMPYFPIDIDGEGSLEEAREIIRFLKDRGVPVQCLRVFFSGMKGFHILIPNQLIGSEPSENVSSYMRRFAELLLGDDVDLSIYNHVRLFRYPNTRHGRSGLFKYELSIDQLMTLSWQEIKALAVKPSAYRARPCSAGRNLYLSELWEEAKAKSVTFTIQMMGKPEHKAPVTDHYCYHAIMQDGVSKGYRNETLVRVAWILKKSGLTYDMALQAALRWNDKNKPPLDEKEVANTVKSVYEHDYKFGCSDPVLQRYCTPECPIYQLRMKKAETQKEVYDVRQLAVSYQKFAQLWAEQAISFDHPAIDSYFRGLLPGFLVYIIARPGVGKTSLAVDLIYRMAVRNIPLVFFSLEMSKEMIFERLASRALQIAQKEILNRFYDSLNENVLEQLENTYRRIVVNDKTGIDLEYMKNYVKMVESSILGTKIKVVVIDHFTAIAIDGKSPYEQASKKALGLQQLAKELELAVIVLTHANRQAGKGDVEVDIEMGRDSSVIEDTADLILTMWKDDMDYRYVKIAKNRYGVSGVTFRTMPNFETNTWHISI